MKTFIHTILFAALACGATAGELNLDSILAKAKAGDPEAEYLIGCILSDNADSIGLNFGGKWFRESANQGFVPAILSLAMSKSQDRSQTNDVSRKDSCCRESMSLYVKAADLGSPHAQFALGDAYRVGECVSQSDEIAVRWFRLAAEAGHVGGQYRLGLMKLRGTGVSQSAEDAVRWLKAAANQDTSDQEDILRAHFGPKTSISNELAERCGFELWMSECTIRAAKCQLGFVYAGGMLGGHKDLDSALKWFRAAGEAGDAKALNMLAIAYSAGQGVEANDTTALYWCRLAADKGDAEAQCRLGSYYLKGYGTTADTAEGVLWITKAADGGNTDAQYFLGLSYSGGMGVLQNFADAFAWFQKAANQGHSGAQEQLGGCYLRGAGTNKDYVAAHMWYNLASAKGSASARDMRDKLAKTLSMGEITKAQAMAKAFRPTVAQEADDPHY